MQLQKFMQLTKVDVAQKRIYGIFTAEQVDKSGEVADYETTKKAMQEWSQEIEKASQGKSLGNIRKMHGKEVVGKVDTIIYDDATKTISGCVEANDQTIEEANKGFLNGFSIGGTYAKKWPCPVNKGKTRFTPVIAEISVVDNPCVPDAVFNAIKDASFTVIGVDGAERLQKFAPKEDVEPKQKWEANDGTTHLTKAAAKEKNIELATSKITSAILDVLKGVDTAIEDLDKRDFTGKEREKAAATGDALPDGSFPIKNKEDLKNAIHAYGRAKDKKKARAHIKAKAKEMDAMDLLPEKWGKMAADQLQKGMYQVARLASLIGELNWLVNDVKMEEAMEDDEKSIAPEELIASVKQLAACLEMMVQEETAEIMEGHDCMEAAAGLTESAVTSLRKAMKDETLLKDWKAPASDNEELVKITAERDALIKAVDQIGEQVKDKFEILTKRIKVLEALPMPDNAQIITVTKGEESDEVKKAAPNISMSGASPGEFFKMINR